jgi:hypothetical protein
VLNPPVLDHAEHALVLVVEIHLRRPGPIQHVSHDLEESRVRHDQQNTTKEITDSHRKSRKKFAIFCAILAKAHGNGKGKFEEEMAKAQKWQRQRQI